MVLLSPWGLLALLGIPILVGLHFFRQQRRERRIGGLHLWEQARVASPSGKKLQRLYRSLPLFLGILAIIALALLLAGLDLPAQEGGRHITVLLDDSVSMQARGDGSSAASRAREAILKLASDSQNRITLITAGARPAVVAGPAAVAQEIDRALKVWSPSAAMVDWGAAADLGLRIGQPDVPLYMVTDAPARLDQLSSGSVVAGTGNPAPNAAIVFADRFRRSATSDRIAVTVKSFSGSVIPVTAELSSGAKVSGSKEIVLSPGIAQNIEWDVASTSQTMVVRLRGSDALSADDEVALVPVPERRVMAYTNLPGAAGESARRALTIINATAITANLSEADLAFVSSGTLVPASVPRVHLFSGEGTTQSLRLAPGQQLLVDGADPVLENVPLDGVVWAYHDSMLSGSAVLSYSSATLASLRTGGSKNATYTWNINLGQSNLLKSPAWPVVIMQAVEDARRTLSGLSKTNFRSGEDILYSASAEVANQPASLWRDGDADAYAKFEAGPPAVLRDLPPGLYTFRSGSAATEEILARFSVNLLSETESNLLDHAEKVARVDGVFSDKDTQQSRNPIIFFVLMVTLIGSALGAWVYHDAGY